MIRLKSIRAVRMVTVAAIIMMSLMGCAIVWAQGGATAQMHGVVRDGTGAVVPGAVVKATQTDTSVERTATTGVDGGYVLTNLPLGPYRLEVSKQGFATNAQTGIRLTIGSAPAIDMSLQVGSVTQAVEVQATAPLVETQSTSVGQLVDSQRVLDLPLNGRQVTDLITLTAGSTSNNAAQSAGRTIGGPPHVSLAGGSTQSVGYKLDGANYYNYTSATTYPMPFPDALQEFRVDTSGFTASQSTFAQVTAATKSGTNAVHGDVFWFVRNGVFNAQNTLAPTKDNLKRNQFGGTIGGPLVKSKLFLFGGYQGTTIRSNNVVNPAILPTQDMLLGNDVGNAEWTTYFSAACNHGNQLNPSPGAPFTFDPDTKAVTFDPGEAAAPALNLLNAVVPTAPTPDACGNLLYANPAHINNHQFLGRLDYQSGKHSLFARYFGILDNNMAPGFLTDNLLAATGTGSNSVMNTVVLGHTFVATSNIVNSLRLTMTKLRYRVSGKNYFDGCDLGINMYCGNYPGATVNFIMGNAFSIGVNLKNGAHVNSNSYDLDEDVSVLLGSHQISFGAAFGLDMMNQTDCFFCSGVLVGSSGATGTYISDFLSGRDTIFTQSARWHNSIREWRLNLYALDSWKVTPRFTVTLGVRWEPWIPETLTSGNVASFDSSRFKALESSTVYPDSPPGFIYPGDPSFPNGLKGLNNHWNQWAPRVGIAWDPTGSGTTSVRASWGLSYNQLGAHMHDDQTQQAPFYNLTQGLGGAIPGTSFANPWLIPYGPNGSTTPFPNLVGTIPPYTLLTALPLDIKQPYTMTYNLSVQRQLSPNWVVSLSYIGSQTRRIWNTQPLNYALCPSPPAFPNATNCSIGNLNPRRILNLENPGFTLGSLLLINSSGTANYNGMLLSVEHRLSNNYSIQANWTWSHCISDFDPKPTGDAGEDDWVWTDPTNMRFDRGNCDNDNRQIFNLTGIARTPDFTGRSWGRLARGWQLSPIFRLVSGQPLNIILPGDPSGNGAFDPIKGSFFQRANCNPGVDPYGPSGPGDQYLNPAAFSPPDPGTLGNCPYNGFHAPVFWQFDAALSRRFGIHENQYIEVRAEAFNILNKFRPGYCDAVYSGCQFLISPYLGQMTFSSRFTQLGGSTFGKIINAMDPRIMQFAVKYVF